MTFTFYWHDYETWGADPRRDRPAQFAGLRTDAQLNPIGEPGHDYVGLDLFHGDVEAGDGRQALGETAGVDVVFFETLGHLFEGEEAGRREDADLTHAAAEHLAKTAGLVDEVAVAAQD